MCQRAGVLLKVLMTAQKRMNAMRSHAASHAADHCNAVASQTSFKSAASHPHAWSAHSSKWAKHPHVAGRQTGRTSHASLSAQASRAHRDLGGVQEGRAWRANVHKRPKGCDFHLPHAQLSISLELVISTQVALPKQLQLALNTVAGTKLDCSHSLN